LITVVDIDIAPPVIKGVNIDIGPPVIRGVAFVSLNVATSDVVVIVVNNVVFAIDTADTPATCVTVGRLEVINLGKLDVTVAFVAIYKQ